MTTYYVDATGGDNQNDGLSPDNAWKTVAKVNAGTFGPGDEILFKRGETWAGTTLEVPSSGAAGNPIRFADYGTGAKPVIDGNDAVVCVLAQNKDYLEFENIEAARGVSSGFEFSACSYVELIYCDAHDHGNDGVLFIAGCHHCAVTGGDFYNGYEAVAGTFITGIEVTNGSHDIIVRRARCTNNAGAACGISVHSHAGETMPYNVTIKDCECRDNGSHGIQILKQDDTADADRNIVVRDCMLCDNGQDGLRIYKDAAAVSYANGIMVDRCECYGNGQYSAFVQADNVTLQHSIFADNDAYAYECQDITIHNCTFYNGTEAAGAFYVGGGRSQNFTMKNCIIQCDVAGQLICAVYSGCGVTGWDVDYNLYRRIGGTEANTYWHYLGTNYTFADWQAQTGGDANSAYGDAWFVDPLNDNFHLQLDSPARDMGVDIGLPYAGSAPDAGGYEYTGCFSFGSIIKGSVM